MAQYTVAPGREHFDSENGSKVDDVTALLFLHLRQGGGYPVKKSLDIDVDLPIPFIHLKVRDRCDGHNAGVIHDDIHASKTVDGFFDECFHFSALRDIPRRTR